MNNIYITIHTIEYHGLVVNVHAHRLTIITYYFILTDKDTRYYVRIVQIVNGNRIIYLNGLGKTLMKSILKI